MQSCNRSLEHPKFPTMGCQDLPLSQGLFSVWILLVFKNPLLFLSSMFTVARSGAVSDMYSGDAPPCLIMNKYGECATKEIFCLWLELLFASPPCLPDCLSLPRFTLNILIQQIWAAARQNWFTVRFIGQSFPELCYDRLQGWEGVWKQTELSAQITEHRKQNLWTFQNVPSTTPRPGERTRDPPHPPPPTVHYNPVPGQLIGQHSIKEQKIMFRENSRAKLRQPFIFIMLSTACLFFLIPFSHAMCRPNLCWPCTESRRLSFQLWQQECRWAHPHEGAGRGGRCAQRLVRTGGLGGVDAPRARGNRCCNELAKLIQIFGVLALIVKLLSLPVTLWELRLSGSNARPVSW